MDIEQWHWPSAPVIIIEDINPVRRIEKLQNKYYYGNRHMRSIDGNHVLSASIQVKMFVMQLRPYKRLVFWVHRKWRNSKRWL